MIDANIKHVKLDARYKNKKTRIEKKKNAWSYQKNERPEMSSEATALSKGF